MRYSTSVKKTTHHTARSPGPDASAGPNGIAIAPPPCGIDIVDLERQLGSQSNALVPSSQPIQRQEKKPPTTEPETESEAAATIQETSTLSGANWVSQFPTSTSISDLDPTFSANVTKFMTALQAAGATISISATKRPAERAYLMHWAWRIVKENYDASTVPGKDGVNINWWHGDQAKSKQAAQEMVDGYGINNLGVAPSTTSRHISGKAIDMTISWNGELKIKNASGTEQVIKSSPKDGTNSALIAVGKTYEVIHFTNVNKDKVHWSTDGK